jgi:hypothetical protein
LSVEVVEGNGGVCHQVKSEPEVADSASGSGERGAPLPGVRCCWAPRRIPPCLAPGLSGFTVSESCLSAIGFRW